MKHFSLRIVKFVSVLSLNLINSSLEALLWLSLEDIFYAFPTVTCDQLYTLHIAFAFTTFLLYNFLQTQLREQGVCMICDTLDKRLNTQRNDYTENEFDRTKSSNETKTKVVENTKNFLVR